MFAVENTIAVVFHLSPTIGAKTRLVLFFLNRGLGGALFVEAHEASGALFGGDQFHLLAKVLLILLE